MGETGEIQLNSQGITTNPSYRGYLVVLFLIWPFMAFLIAARNFHYSFSRKIILAFFALYGFTFYINPLMDGQRYASFLRNAYERNAIDFISGFESVFQSSETFDFVQPLLTVFVSIFTDSYHFLFAAFALFFGYFHLRSTSLLYREYPLENRNPNALIFLLFLFCVIPIFDINGFRMWTAAWVYFLGVYCYMIGGGRKFILLALFSMAVHFSFILPCVVLAAYAWLGNRNVLYFPMALGSFFLSELPIPAIRGFMSRFGGGIEYKFKTYSNANYGEIVAAAQQESAWFLAAPKWVLYCFVAILVSVYFRMRRIKADNGFENLFSFTLLLLTFSNIASLIPSGGRFQRLFLLFATAVLFLYYSKYDISLKVKNLVWISLLPMLLYLLIALRVGAETVNTILFLPSPAILFYFETPWPVKDWLF